MANERTKRWVLKQAAPGVIAAHVKALGISPLLGRMLALRDLVEPDAGRRYLFSTLRSDLPSPFLMADMHAAADRIVHAIRRHERIGVWGDYDVDGTTGASILVLFLRELGAEAVYHVPHRIEEGYGLNIAGLQRLSREGVRLLVTVDCGISNIREAEAAREMGLDLVIVDHHQLPQQLPPAVAVINPHRDDCLFPDKCLCAAGLAFYLTIGVRAKLRELGWFKETGDPDLRRYLDIVALGTIADMVPLNGVNRTLIRRGLQELKNTNRPGVLALKQVANIRPGEVSARQVGFHLGPRINAAGRVDYAVKVVELLTTDCTELALQIAQELERNNRERRALEAEVLSHALAQASPYVTDGRYSLILCGEGWHPGVLGIVASRMVERFYRPTVVIGFNDGEGKGSARSIRGFHMIEAFRRCAGCLEKFGGHEYAGGLTIKQQQLEAFVDSFERAVRDRLTDDDLIPIVEIDAELSFADIGQALVRDLQSLKPFGIGNPEPIFLTRRVQVCERKVFSGGARFRLRHDGRFVGAVRFGSSEEAYGEPGAEIDIVYQVSESEWSGYSTLELKIVDARLASPQLGN